jgi:HlyD family secretion protein
MSGHVIKVDLKVGQPVGPTSGLVHIADLTRWVVETTDLSELSVVSIALGDRAVVRFDALPDLSLEGTVTVIEALGEMTRGEIAYRVTITPEQVDPRLRWNMTADVSIMPTQGAE